MNRYAMEFSKTGMIRYTSHLDMLRLFKRTLRKTGVPLAYSQGFNPHPKLGFAQPLSLGYEAKSDYIEFETVTPVDTSELLTKTAAAMPAGITVSRCVPVLDNVKVALHNQKEFTYSALTGILRLPRFYRLEKEMDDLETK